MAYNPYGAPGYGPPPSYGSYPGASGPPGMAPPPGLGPPPGMSAPGMAPPGVHQPSITQANRPSGLPASFQPPTNMPDINFNAPVIRLGTSGSKSNAPGPGQGRKDDGPGMGGRPGLGADRPDQGRSTARESIMALVPPTKDEIIRTIFVGSITDGTGGNAGIERLMGTAGKLKRWDRAIGSDGKELPFGFAQFEDVESLAAAVEVLKDIEVPIKAQTPADGPAPEDDDFAEFDKIKLQITVDQASLDYLDTYKESRGDDAVPESRIQTAKSLLKQAVRDLFYPPLRTAQDADGDVAMADSSAQHGENVEVVNIPLAQEDELADIPAEMRETVAAEIAAFRDRSHQRDLERLRQEEEFEAAERARNGQPRPSRLDSPPAQSSSNIPLGPRGAVPNAPSGPRGQRVAFVNGGTQNGEISINRDDDDTDASDEELYRREIAKKEAEEEKLFLEAERRWVNRERSRAAALEREKEREEADLEKERKNREIMSERFKNWDDDREAARKSELYHRDRSAWIRERTTFRAREVAQDDADRKAEERERIKEEAEKEQARGQADSFLERQALEMQEREAAVVSAPQPFKLKLKMQPQRAGPKRRTVAEVEGLLEDEEDQNTTRRQLIPIEPSATAQLSDEENQQAVRALAQEIPSDKDGLWAWDIKWEHLDETAIEEKLRPFVEKKIVDYLGVQEQMLVNMVEEHLRKKSKPHDMIVDLNEALDDAEAEDLVKKVWRMVIFYTECEKRGLSA